MSAKSAAKRSVPAPSQRTIAASGSGTASTDHDEDGATSATTALATSGLHETVVAHVGDFIVSKIATVTEQNDDESSGSPSASATSLTHEQMERMRANRERAQARLESRKRAAAEPP